tara:strand:+ start:482 stop:646 length:165 start_codon:yes stop_codon:yes gene_type:complete
MRDYLRGLIELDKRSAKALQHHFNLSDYQMLILSWLAGLIMGLCSAFIVHYLFY